MQNPAVQKNGYIILTNSRGTHLSAFDTRFSCQATTIMDRAFPIQWKMLHVCHTNAVFPLVSRALKAMLSKMQRQCFLLHNGLDEMVLETLSEHGLPEHCVPRDLGGSLQVSPETFVQNRLIAEGGSLGLIDHISRNLSIPQENNIVLNKNANNGTTGGFVYSSGHNYTKSIRTGPTSSASQVGASHVHHMLENNHSATAISGNNYARPLTGDQHMHIQPIRPEPTSSQEGSLSVTSYGHPWLQNNHIAAAIAVNNVTSKVQAVASPAYAQHLIGVENASAILNVPGNNLDNDHPNSRQPKRIISSSDSGNKRKKSRATPEADKGKHGRKGNPLMNRAVEVRLNNPNFSLAAALMAGGFVFPDFNAQGVSMSDVRDTDNVTLYQRRNQLLRRLRHLKGKGSEPK